MARKPQQFVIRDFGGAAFRKLVGDAVIIMKEDDRLVGLDKLRLALAKAACLRAITGEVRMFVLPKNLSRKTVSLAWCDELVAACALRLKLEGMVHKGGDPRECPTRPLGVSRDDVA